MGGFWEPFGGVTGGILTALAIYELYCYFRAKLVPSYFVVGVVPSEDELAEKGPKFLNSIWTADSLFEVRFKQCIFARRIKNGQDILKLRTRCLESNREAQFIREICLSGQHTLGIDFIVLNRGRRHGTYRLAVSLDDPRIGIVAAKGEPPLMPEGFYSYDPDDVKDPVLRKLDPSEPVRRIYRRLGISGSYLSFTEGSIESGAYDVIHLELAVPRDCKFFLILFNVDHMQVPLRETTYYAQPIRIVRSQ